MKHIKSIQYTFWPSLHNSFHPFLIRKPALALILVFMMVFQVTVYIDGQRGDVLGLDGGVSQSDVIEQTNEERLNRDAGVLVEDEALMEAAQSKAQHMLDENYWDHYAPDGTTPWSFINGAGYRYELAGENLAKNFQTSRGVVQGWMNSPDHRDNLLRDEYRDIGLGIASGRLDGRQTTIVVAMYGTPEAETVATAPVADASDGAPMVLPAAETYSPAQSLSFVGSMPLSAQVTSIIALLLGMVYLGQHVMIRRKHVMWDSHVHPRPALQAVALFSLVVILVQLSYGAVI